jgi:hypothetical protein
VPDTALMPDQSLQASLTKDGYVFVHADAMRRALEAFGSLDDWSGFVASWNDLEIDPYMADGGRYRRRRHVVFAGAPDGAITRQPARPHFQALDYNPLNGGVARWFAPVTPAVGDGSSMRTILAFCHALFSQIENLSNPSNLSNLSNLFNPGRCWQIEVHQFRIEARPGAEGLPTPEGMHRDGVDYVLVLLVNRSNIASGTTAIHAADGRELGRFTLTRPFDAALVDDARVSHGVTAVQALDASAPAYRDVLVVTFKREVPGRSDARSEEPGGRGPRSNQ